MRDRLLRALRGLPVDTLPIWLMRQAGRYLPGYRELRARHSILEIARTPELAAKVTLEPLQRFDVDAAVVFADISLPFAGLGISFQVDPGVGPVVAHPVRTREQVDRLTPFDAKESVGFVAEAIRQYHSQETSRPIIGFAGAPFTLAAYLVEGSSSREFSETRSLMYRNPELFQRLLDRLAGMTVDYLTLQAKAGADALQLFDTWVGLLGPNEFDRFLRPVLKQIFDALRSQGLPMIYFSTNSTHLLGQFGHIGADALGVDWRLPLSQVRQRVGLTIPLQGNLDPGALLGTTEVVKRTAKAVMDELPNRRGHVFNLGHGVLPQTDPNRVKELVDFVHEAGRVPSSS
jgi:uroporphyrinogen decarboxylase